MRDAEEVAVRIQQELMGHEHASMTGGPGCYPCGVITDDFAGHEADTLADLIRARDAEVRAATLAEFTVERRTREDGHAGWAGDRFGGLNSGRIIFRHATRERRLVGPWEPES